MSSPGPGGLQRRRLILGAGAAVFIVVLATVLGFLAGRHDSAPSPAAPSAASSRAAPSGASTPVSGLATVAVASLPSQARDTLVLIDKGGPFPYSRDGIVFANAERILPQHERGYYHEYTVPTPGSRDRGARRIVTGSAGDLYYTDDHYASFRQILR